MMYKYENIGVVITRYKESRYELLKAIESVINNSISVKNIIIINDNPSDPLSSNEVLSSNYINNNSRIGVAQSRNIGIKYFFDKKWIAFLDADDVWVFGKIFSQLNEITPQINIVSTGMLEKSWYGDVVRIPDVRELKWGGNPCFMSSILVRNCERLFFENVKIEDRDFINKFSIEEIFIIKKPLIYKYNYAHRRGGDLLASFDRKKNHSSIKFNPYYILLFKIISIKKININLFRIFFHILSMISGSELTPKKRISLSLNIFSNEYKNLKCFSNRFDILMYLKYCFFLPVTQRNRWLLDSSGFKQSFIAYVCGALEQTRYIYVGLPGARWVSDVIDLMPHKKFIHVCHGQPSSEKFFKKTYGSIFENQKFNLNTNHAILIKNNLQFKYDPLVSVWLHGYPKGKSYSISNLFFDLKILHRINKTQKLVVYPHPTARLLKFFLFLFFYKIEKIKKFNENVILANTIYVSSPTLLTYLKQLDLDSRLSIINVRLDRL